MKKLARIIWYGLIFLQKTIMVIGGCVIAILIFVEVFLRYVLASPLFGVEELILFIAMWMYFLGASYGAYERTHIQAELLHLWFKNKRSYTRVKSVACVITVFLSITMIKWSYPYFIWGITRGAKSQALLLPMVISQSAVFIGSILMSIYFTAELIDYLLQGMGRKPFFVSNSEKGN
jgi:TRAP-type C4-dicarboxylate transport system permease small subunit